METLAFRTNAFGGVVVDPALLPGDVEAFRRALAASVGSWAGDGHRAVWLEVPIDRAALIPAAVEAGFCFHHSATDYLMLTYRLMPEAFIPPYASHYIGAGGVVLNEKRELLVVWEAAHRRNGRRYYKLPGGALHQGEHLVDGVIREVREETGVDTRFEALVCFRHWHGYRFGKSDIYFVCRLSPVTQEIQAQQDEIAECLWMPVDEYMASEHVGAFNRHIVQVALDQRALLVPSSVEGYDPSVREVFMPPQGRAE